MLRAPRQKHPIDRFNSKTGDKKELSYHVEPHGMVGCMTTVKFTTLDFDGMGLFAAEDIPASGPLQADRVLAAKYGGVHVRFQKVRTWKKKVVL
jgi:hypothetical protein